VWLGASTSLKSTDNISHGDSSAEKHARIQTQALVGGQQWVDSIREEKIGHVVVVLPHELCDHCVSVRRAHDLTEGEPEPPPGPTPVHANTDFDLSLATVETRTSFLFANISRLRVADVGAATAVVDATFATTRDFLLHLHL
jgi:hypothetical protein